MIFSQELQPVGKGQKNRQPKPKPAQPKKVLPKKRPAAAIESSGLLKFHRSIPFFFRLSEHFVSDAAGHNEDAVAAEEVEPRKSALRKRLVRLRLVRMKLQKGFQTSLSRWRMDRNCTLPITTSFPTAGASR